MYDLYFSLYSFDHFIILRIWLLFSFRGKAIVVREDYWGRKAIFFGKECLT